MVGSYEHHYFISKRDHKKRKLQGESGRGGGGGGMNWEIEIDIYTLICTKQITNKNLLYKKINKTKLSRRNLN